MDGSKEDGGEGGEENELGGGWGWLGVRKDGWG